MWKFKITILFLFLLQIPVIAQDLDHSIIQGFNIGNSNLIEPFLAEEVEVILPNDQGSMSKNLAGKKISEFFKSIEISQFKLVHEGASPSGSYYHIGELKGKEMGYRVYLLNVGEEHTEITEIRIDEEK